MSKTRNTLILLAVAIVIISCEKKTLSDGTIALSAPDQPAISPVLENSPVMPEIEIGKHVFSSGDISEYKFGSFYNDNVSFYILDNYPFQMHKKEYNSTLVLCFIHEILYKKKYFLDTLELKDFAHQYKCQKKVDAQIGEAFKNNRFFNLKVNGTDKEVRLIKSDFNAYEIEEYHSYFQNAWDQATLNHRPSFEELAELKVR